MKARNPGRQAIREKPYSPCNKIIFPFLYQLTNLDTVTLVFSKKRENFDAAVGLHFGFYNFVKRHNTLKTTPAVVAGVVSKQWNGGQLLEATA